MIVFDTHTHTHMYIYIFIYLFIYFVMLRHFNHFSGGVVFSQLYAN